MLDAHSTDPAGVLRTTRNLGSHIGHRRVYRIMKSNGLVVPSPAKAKKRKWVRYERIYSNSMWHTDWHAIKDARMKGLNLITYLDDASRCVTGAALFNDATSDNAVTALRDAVTRFGAPATILSDNGSCFVGRGGRKKQTGSWTPTPVRERAARTQHRIDQLKAVSSPNQWQARTIPPESGERDLAL